MVRYNTFKYFSHVLLESRSYIVAKEKQIMYKDCFLFEFFLVSIFFYILQIYTLSGGDMHVAIVTIFLGLLMLTSSALGKDWHYYISADEVDWNYAPFNANRVTNDNRQVPHLILSVQTHPVTPAEMFAFLYGISAYAGFNLYDKLM
jgi:hypothetical protein